MKIVRTSLFDKSLKKLGASAKDLQKLEDALLANRAAGDVIQGPEGSLWHWRPWKAWRRAGDLCFDNGRRNRLPAVGLWQKGSGGFIG
jgi:hypothetical protein